LVGLWKAVEGDEPSYLFIGRPSGVENRPDSLMVIHGARLNADQELSWDESPLFVFPVKLGESYYLQFVVPAGNEKITTWEAIKEKVYIFLKYQVADGRLTLWSIDNKAAAKAIKDGALTGKVKESKTNENPEVELTEPTEGLRRYFLSDRGKLLFPDSNKATFERVK